MPSAVIRFPGSNCERDVFDVMRKTGLNPRYVWHTDTDLPDSLDLVVIPGGFTYGDYLRCGAMAAHSPIMQSVRRFAEQGGRVLGICNGFQILCETGLLPGTLMKNDHLRFVCRPVHLRVEQTHSDFTRAYEAGQIVEMPVAHHEGNYVADDDTLQRLHENGQIVFRYCDTGGRFSDEANPNGSRGHIAGIRNERGNVFGLMPHPERYADAATGGTDGLGIFRSLATD